MAQTLRATPTRIPCPRCRLPLMGHESRCPACGKRIFVAEWMIAVALVLVVGLAALGIVAAGHLKAAAERTAAGHNEAYEAAKEFVLKQPGVKGPAVFVPARDALFEQWGPRKFRVAGRAEAHDASGAGIRIMYTCVVERDQESWMLHDISVQFLK